MDKPLRDWIESDVANLVNSGRTEGRSLEFKQELWDNGERGSRDFLRDVCGMANSEGGLLLVGIAERRDARGNPTGEPDIEAPLGIECDNPEQVLLGYEARVLDCVDPRLTVESHSINLQSGKRVLAFRLPNSLEKPHRVFYQGKASFPARRERRIYELNASEIRDLVMKTASRLDEAEKAISDSLTRESIAHDFPVLTAAAIPAFTRNFAVDFRSRSVIETFSTLDLLAQGGKDWVNPTYTSYGISRSRQITPTASQTLTLSHNGLLHMTVPLLGRVETKLFFPMGIDRWVRGLALNCQRIFTSFGLGAPVLLGAALQIGSEVFTAGEFELQKHRIKPTSRIYPSVIIQTIEHKQEIERQIRPLCDLIHQSLGEPHSPAFDDEGNWMLTTGA